MEVRVAPSGGVCGSVWELTSAEFGIEHRLTAPALRPSWRWLPGRRPDCGWSVAEKNAQPKLKRPKRKQSELQPGAKEAEQEAAARQARELLEQYVPGRVVEVRGTDDGFLGSWYSARVLEAKEARSTVKLRVCYQAFREEDGSTWEASA